MSVKKITISRASQFHFTGHFGFIGQYVPGRLTEKSFPIPVIIIDADTKQEYNANLVSVIGFTYGVIPDHIKRFFIPAGTTEEDLLTKNKVSSINQLGLYVYESENISNDPN